jgi:hypothetical protein
MLYFAVAAVFHKAKAVVWRKEKPEAWRKAKAAAEIWFPNHFVLVAVTGGLIDYKWKLETSDFVVVLCCLHLETCCLGAHIAIVLEKHDHDHFSAGTANWHSV